MARQSKLTSTKRFGPRYGITVKQRFDAIEQMQKKLYQCPNCKKMKVKRLALGIWQCLGCQAKFAGKAYTFGAEVQVGQQEQEELKLTLTRQEEQDQEETQEHKSAAETSSEAEASEEYDESEEEEVAVEEVPEYDEEEEIK